MLPPELSQGSPAQDAHPVLQKSLACSHFGIKYRWSHLGIMLGALRVGIRVPFLAGPIYRRGLLDRADDFDLAVAGKAHKVERLEWRGPSRECRNSGGSDRNCRADRSNMRQPKR